jgi:hypothetical protein
MRRNEAEDSVIIAFAAPLLVAAATWLLVNTY